MDPYVASSDGVTTLSSPVRLAQLKNELSSLKNKYSESHPDIKRLIREIDGLEKEVTADALFQPEQDMDEISNPLYRQIKIKIDLTEKELARANIERAIHAGRSQGVSRTSCTHPRSAAQLRRYDPRLRKYQAEISGIARQAARSRCGTNLESENKAESFTLIEPPLRPTESVKPNRPNC